MPSVTFTGPLPFPGWRLREPGTGALIEVPAVSRLAVTTAEAAVDGAIRHIGATRLFHYQVADAVKTGALQIVLEDYEPEPVPVSLVHAAKGQLPLKMRRFLDFAAPKLRSVLTQLG